MPTEHLIFHSLSLFIVAHRATVAVVAVALLVPFHPPLAPIHFRRMYNYTNIVVVRRLKPPPPLICWPSRLDEATWCCCEKNGIQCKSRHGMVATKGGDSTTYIPPPQSRGRLERVAGCNRFEKRHANNRP